MTGAARPLRILMTTDAVGGVWVYATALAGSLARGGHRVHLVTLGPTPTGAQPAEVKAIPGLTLESTDLALEWMDPEGADMGRAARVLGAIEQRFRPDLVHLNSYREAAFDWQTPRVVVAHSCVRSWWLACRGCEPSEPRWRSYIAKVERGLAAAQRWVAPTKAFRDTIETLYEPAIAGAVIWNGLPSLPMAQSKEPFVLAAGRFWDEAKNLAALAAVADTIAWPIRIAGAARGEERVAAGNMHRLGTLPRREVLAQMQRAGIFVAPARYEPFGLGILEAALSGCALVISDIPTLRELWTEAAAFVDPQKPSALRDTVNRLCRDDGLRAALQRAGMQRARCYSLSAMTQAYDKLYATMLAGAVHPAQVVHASLGAEMAR